MALTTAIARASREAQTRRRDENRWPLDAEAVTLSTWGNVSASRWSTGTRVGEDNAARVIVRHQRDAASRSRGAHPAVRREPKALEHGLTPTAKAECSPS